MNKLFRFFLTSAAIAAALVGVVSCQKDYSGDIEDLNNKVTQLTQKLNDLQTSIQNGEIVTNVEKTAGGIKVTTNKNTYEIVNGKDGKDGTDGKDGKDGTDGKDGKDGKDGSVVKIGDNGHWIIDNVDTGIAAAGKDGKDGTDGKDGKDGKDGSVVTIGENGNWFIDGKDTGLHAGGISAVWAEDTLTIYNEKGEVIASISLVSKLKGLAFVPEKIFDGLGLITVYEFTAPENNKEFPFVNKEGKATFITTAPTEVTYRMDASTVDVEQYDWSFIDRSVWTVDPAATKAAADGTKLVAIKDGPTKDGSFVDFTIQLTDEVEPVALGKKDNVIVALRAVDAEGEPVVSDYAYIEKQTNEGYDLIHKDKYKVGNPRYYRTEANEVKIDADTDCNKGKGIEVRGNLNPATPYLVVDSLETINLLEYVETYAEQLGDLISTAGIDPTYKFYFAGVDKDGKVLIDKDSAKAVYLSDDEDKTNQNDFVTLDGSFVSINRDKYTTGNPAIGRTPLIYVQSIYNGIVLAEGFIKIEIAEKAPVVDPEVHVPTKGFKIFIRHSAEFDIDEIVEGTYGENGIGKDFLAPNTDYNYDADEFEKVRELNVAWEEMNLKMFNVLGMSYEQFLSNYEADPQKLMMIVTSKNLEPGDLENALDGDQMEEAGLTMINLEQNIATVYKNLDKHAAKPKNMEQNTNIVNLMLSKTMELGGPHFVYVVYPALDNMVNPDAVIKFVYNIKVTPHEHDFQLDEPDGSATEWILNPDYVLGNQLKLNTNTPDRFGDYGPNYNVGDKDYGAVRIKGQEGENNSGIIEHFKEYYVPVDKAEDGTVFRFTIMNFPTSSVDFKTPEEIENSDFTYGTVTMKDELGNDAEFAYVEMTKEQFVAIISPAQNPNAKPSPEIYIKGLLLDQDRDVLIQVTETCSKKYAVKKAMDAYYYVVFEALKPYIDLVDIELGTFKESNDYALTHELIEGIFDAPKGTAGRNKVFEWSDEKNAWVATEAAAIYGVTEETEISIIVDQLIYFNLPDDNKESFGNRLRLFAAGDTALTPYPTEAPNEGGINWWNMGTDLKQDKVAKYHVSVKFTPEGAKEPVVLCSGEAKVTVLATGKKAHPYHNPDGTWYVAE